MLQFRLHREPSPHQAQPLAHANQPDSRRWIAEVRFKALACICDAKTDAYRVRAQFHLRALRLAMLYHVAERFLGDPKETQFHVLRDFGEGSALGEMNIDLILLSHFLAQPAQSRHETNKLQLAGMKLMRER